MSVVTRRVDVLNEFERNVLYMGADMLLMVLWAEQETVVPGPAVAAVRKALTSETNPDIVKRAAQFAGCPDLDLLARAVIDADPDAEEAWLNKIGDAYEVKINDLIASFECRDVTRISLGHLTGYATGAPSWGDAPTQTFGFWDTFFYQTDEDEELLNPYSTVIFNALFLGEQQKWTPVGGRYVSTAVHALPAAA
jgi:hypothetical protein